MSGVEKIKVGLDECRMLALGAQVLIGFQFQAVFQPRFSELPTWSRAAQMMGLLLLLASLGALIVPATQHLLVERLQATRRIETVVTRCLDVALLPLALALGLDVGIQIRSAGGDLLGALCGSAVFVLALAIWFGWTLAARSMKGSKERTMAARRGSEDTPLSKQIDQMLRRGFVRAALTRLSCRAWKRMSAFSRQCSALLTEAFT